MKSINTLVRKFTLVMISVAKEDRLIGMWFERGYAGVGSLAAALRHLDDSVGSTSDEDVGASASSH